MKTQLLLLAMLGTLLGHAEPAVACTTLGYSLEVSDASSPTGEFAFRVITEDGGDPSFFSVKVSDDDGLHLGGLSKLRPTSVLENGNRETWWGWKPETLAFGKYDATLVNRAHGETLIGGSFALTVARSPHAFDISWVTPVWSMGWSQETTCCKTTEDGQRCPSDCPGHRDLCEVCWPDRYVYNPSLMIDTFSNRLGLIEYELIHGDHIDTKVVSASMETKRTLVGLEGITEPLCIRAKHIVDGQVTRTSDYSCRNLSDFPELERIEFDNSDLVAQCYEPPVNQMEPGVDAGSTLDMGLESEDLHSEEGCSVTNTSTRSSFGLILIGLFGFLWRRR